MRHSRGIWHTKPHFRWRKSKPLLPFSQMSFFFFSLCSICERPPADSCSLSRCFSSFYTINKTSFFKLWHITGSENHMEIHANSTSCAPAGLGSVIHILDVIYYRLNVTRQLDKRTHVVLFFFLRLQTQRLRGNCTMLQVLLVVPRFLLLDLKFFLHDPVSQHLRGSRSSHTLWGSIRVLNISHTRSHTQTNTHKVINAFSPPPFSWSLHRNPAAGTGVRSSQDGQTHTQRQTHSHTHTDRRTTHCWRNSATFGACFRYMISK